MDYRKTFTDEVIARLHKVEQYHEEACLGGSGESLDFHLSASRVLSQVAAGVSGLSETLALREEISRLNHDLGKTRRDLEHANLRLEDYQALLENPEATDAAEYRKLTDAGAIAWKTENIRRFTLAAGSWVVVFNHHPETPSHGKGKWSVDVLDRSRWGYLSFDQVLREVLQAIADACEEYPDGELASKLKNLLSSKIEE